MTQDPRTLTLFGTVLRTQNKQASEVADEIPVMIHAERPTASPSFDGRLVWKHFLSDILDQEECGACYAFSVTSALQDRFRLFTKNEVKPVLNPLQAVACHNAGLTAREHQLSLSSVDFRKSLESRIVYTACRGGTLYDIARYYYRLGAVDTSCVPFSAVQDYINHNDQLPMCSDLTGIQHNRCSPPTDGIAQRVWPCINFYVVSDSTDLHVIADYMKYDICTKGPISAGFNMYEDFVSEYDGVAIYIPKTGQNTIGGHAVKIVGWGSAIQDEVLVHYWICANSWGKDWGNDGYYRMQIANPMLETEYNHLAVIPQVPGVMKYFPLLNKASKIIDADRILKEEIEVNPFTLYPKTTTLLIQQGKLQGDLRPIFKKIHYAPDSKLFVCNKRPLDQTSRITLAIVIAVSFVTLVLVSILIGVLI